MPDIEARLALLELRMAAMEAAFARICDGLAIKLETIDAGIAGMRDDARGLRGDLAAAGLLAAPPPTPRPRPRLVRPDGN